MAPNPKFQADADAIAAQLDALADSIEADADVESAATYAALLDLMERRTATCRSFLVARQAGAEVFLFSSSNQVEAADTVTAGRETEFQWDGWQCIVNR